MEAKADAVEIEGTLDLKTAIQGLTENAPKKEVGQEQFHEKTLKALVMLK